MRKNTNLLAGLFAGLIFCGMALADSEQDLAIEKGAAHFRIFCVNCHGMKADGNGPLARILKIQPTDLTRLKQSSSDGMSVRERVFRAVDGRHKVGEGKEKDMPVFSENLKFSSIVEISEFVEAIQQ